MKKLFGYVTAWLCFILGDMVSNCMNTGFTGWLYPVYNKLMVASVHIQDWSKCDGPWKRVE